MKVVSLFSGAGGMDLGFNNAGFETILAVEFDRLIALTFKKNFPTVKLLVEDISKIDFTVKLRSYARVEGVIGGPPCQSWSEAGSKRGINDPRGKLFYEYIRAIEEINPAFFVAENVPGMMAKRHEMVVDDIKKHFKELGYNLFTKMLNANDYGVPQERERIFYVGFRKDLKVENFEFPEPNEYKPVLKDAIWDIRKKAVPALTGNKTNPDVKVPNHEYFLGGFSPMYMSRNRVRSWNEPSYVIQASGRQCPIHPNAPKMVRMGPNLQIFKPGCEDKYRRLSVRECARIQTFPDNFEFVYNEVNMGYKMIGNAVPVKLAEALGRKIYDILVEKGMRLF